MSDLPPDPRSLHVAAPTEPEAAPPPARARASRPPRRRWPWLIAALAVVVLIPSLAFGLAASSAWRDVDRVQFSAGLSGAASGTNYLIVGTDSRAGIDPTVENAGVIFGEGVGGERTDTIAILRVDGGQVSLLAIPRDLYLPLPSGGSNRINAAFAFGGAPDLVTTIERELGIGVDHYLEIDLAGFLGLVDALGGVTIDFAHPAYDDRSGLSIDQAGPNRLDGPGALAFVRSRRFTEVVDGSPVTDPTSDLGRVRRQQQFLAAVMAELGATRNPLTLLDALRAVAGNVTVDDGLGLFDAASLGLTLRGAEPVTATVPTTRFITASGADVLVLTDESEAVLALFRG